MKSHGLIALGLAATTAAACAKVVVVPVTARLEGEGVFYALPRTVARVLVKVDREVAESAPHAKFAPIFTPGVEAPCGTIQKCAALRGLPGKTTKMSIQQGATITSFGEPDPTQVFMVKFTGGGALDQALSMTWNEAGLLSSASASVTNRTVDIALSGVKLVAGLASKAGAGSALTTIANKKECPFDGHARDKWVIEILASVEPDLDNNLLVANYCDLPAVNRVTGTDENSRDDFDAMRDTEDLRRATQAYSMRALQLVKRRTDVLTGGQAGMLDPVKYVEKLEAIIDAELKALFVGTTNKKTWEVPFEVRNLTPNTPVKVLDLKEDAGVCVVKALVAPDAKAAPSGFELPAANCATGVKPLTVSTSFSPAAADQLFEKVRTTVSPPDGDRSFRYLLPAQVKATVSLAATEYGAAILSVAQLGHVVSLPAKRSSKTLAYDLAMIEATGGLKTFKLGSTGGLEAGTIDALAAAGGTVLDARNARRKEDEAARKANETAADELTILTRQSALLKLKDEICELQKKYGLSCTVQP